MSSYLLDRDLLLSGRPTSNSSHWIDANSNVGLLGQSLYQKNDHELKKTLADVRIICLIFKTILFFLLYFTFLLATRSIKNA
jgi:hypothetical protein